MPTGYTAGILDGEIKTFNQFAKTCMRAFGAAIHMRNDPMDKPYEIRKPSEYYKGRIVDVEKRIKDVIDIEADILIENKVTGLDEEKRRLIKRIIEIKADAKKLEEMLESVKAWTPPTDGHIGFKDFMLSQLTETLDHDGDTKYYLEMINEVERRLGLDMDGEEIRKTELEGLATDLEYVEKHWKEEVDSCDSANEWVKVLFDALKTEENANKEENKSN